MDYPLDLSDDQLMLEGADLEAALATLDSHGWNVNGKINRITWLRVWFQYCQIREDILEIALGTSEEDITSQADNVRRKMDRLEQSRPDFMKVTPEQILTDPLGVGLSSDPGRSFEHDDQMTRQVGAGLVTCIHGGILHTEFLLQRALCSRLKKDTKQLIPIARQSLKIVLFAQSRRDLFRDFQGDLVYLLLTNGLPAAGILAVELLRQEQTRQYAPDILPRSEIIQDLSVFVSALAAVEPGDGNFSICDQGRRALKRVLDQILSPSPLAPSLGSGEAHFYEDSSMYLPIGNDAEFLQWLDHAEWDKGIWIDPLVSAEP